MVGAGAGADAEIDVGTDKVAACGTGAAGALTDFAVTLFLIAGTDVCVFDDDATGCAGFFDDFCGDDSGGASGGVGKMVRFFHSLSIKS